MQGGASGHERYTSKALACGDVRCESSCPMVQLRWFFLFFFDIASLVYGARMYVARVYVARVRCEGVCCMGVHCEGVRCGCMLQGVRCDSEGVRCKVYLTSGCALPGCTLRGYAAKVSIMYGMAPQCCVTCMSFDTKMRGRATSARPSLLQYHKSVYSYLANGHALAVLYLF